MNAMDELTSPPLDPDRARSLVLSIERAGIDTERIHVDAEPPRSTEGTSQVDRKTLTRPGARVVTGLVAGALVGLVGGLIVSAFLDVSTAAVVVATTIGSAVIGALAGLYSRLPMSTELSDTDSGGSSTVRVDISGLSRSDVDAVAQALGSA